MPRTVGDAIQIYEGLGLQYRVADRFFFENAEVLVEINNELYDKHQNVTWLQEQLDNVKARTE